MKLSRLARAIQPTATAVAALLVILLGLRARELRRENRELTLRLRYPHAGMYVPTFRASTADGREVVVGEDPAGGRQVLIVFSTGCSHCQASLPYWRELAMVLDTLSEPPVQLYGLSLDPPDRPGLFPPGGGVEFPIVRFPDEKTRHLYRALGVPQTLALDPEGRIVFAHLGPVESAEVGDSLLAALRRAREAADSRLKKPVGSSG